MIELSKFPDENWYLEQIKDLMTDKRKSKKNREIDFLQKELVINTGLQTIFTGNTEYENITFEKLILSSFTDIENMKVIVDKWGTEKFLKPKKHVNGKLNFDGYVYPWDMMYKRFDDFSKAKINVTLVKKYGINCCPYCNEHFIFNRGYSAVAQLDHFYPRSIYPIFALCLYNLVPSCSACNHIKREKLLGISPHNHNVKFENMKISFRPKSANWMTDESAFDIEFKYDSKNKIEEQAFMENIRKLELYEAYSYHKDYVLELFTKHRINTKEYLESILHDFPDLIHSSEELKRIIFGNYIEPIDYLKRPLSKMTHDILEELNK